MAQSLLLDPDTWSIALDPSGNLCLGPEDWSLAQDAASAIRTFKGEVYYDFEQGVPYFEEILGKWPPLSLIKARLEAAALSVPGVVQAKCYISSIGPDRVFRGQVQVTNTAGKISVASF